MTMQIVIDIDRLPTSEDQFNFYYNQDGYMFFGRSIYDCKKVVVLPEHHGRLIDADFTLEQYDSYCKANCQYSEKQREFMCRACPTGDAIEMIEDAPTIIEADKEKEE